MMRKYFLLLVLGLYVCTVSAQLIKHDNQIPKKQSDLDWYNCSFDQDGVYGAEVNKAYDLLKGKKIKKRPVVALIGTGLDVEHEDLKQSIWFNPKEKANGKDDDKNGLVDDINGWNFLGGKDGQKNYISEVCTDRQCKHKRVGATGGRCQWFQCRRHRRRTASNGY